MIRHRGRVKTWREKIALAAAVAELGGDAEADIGRLRTGQALHRKRMVGKFYPVYVRFEYAEPCAALGLATPGPRGHRSDERKN